MNDTFYIGSYIDDPDYDYNYDWIFKVKKISNVKFEIVDIIYESSGFNRWNTYDIDLYRCEDNKVFPGSFLKFRNEKIEDDDCVTYFNKFNKSSITFSRFKNFDNSKIICLDNLDKIKENIIKNNKILSS